MIFYSLPFLCFFIALLVFVQLIKYKEKQWALFLIANIVFYAFWDIRFLILLFLIIGSSYFSAIQYEKSQKRRFIVFPIVLSLVMLGIFKYFQFFVDSFCGMFHISSRYTLNIILPLGISFYLFQAMSYVFDVQKGVISAERNFIKLAAYISFFPQITSGPIVKARDFLPQLDRVHRIKKENIYSGLQRFTLGLTKKLVFADQIGVGVNAIYSAPGAYNGISILFAVIGYSLQIYFDFSGYSDMAVGIAKMLDFDLGSNFNMPYLAQNPSDFWKRWHISLSSWFQQYVYIPLGGSKCGTAKTYRNLFITMLLSGIWHGANWTFVLWGFLHALGSTLHKVLCNWRKNKKPILAPPVKMVMNFVFVSLLWVVFRAPDMNTVMQIFSGLFRIDGVQYVNVFIIIGILVSLLCSVLSLKKANGNAVLFDLNLETFHGKVLYSVWVFSIIMFMYVGNSAFIYAQF